MGATTRLFFPAGLKIDSIYLAHVGQQSADWNLEDLTIHPAGDAGPNYTGSKSWAPEFSLQSLDVTKVLDLMTTDDICRDMSAESALLYFRAALAYGMTQAHGDSVHAVYQLQNDALLWWEQLQVNQAAELQINLKLAAIDNGSNAMLAALPLQAIEAPGLINAPFTLGDIVINGDVINGIKSFTWSNNCEVVKEASNGGAGPSFICIRRVRPVIQFESTDLQAIAGYDADGEGIESVIVYLRRRQVHKLNYADAEQVHAKLEADAGTGNECGTLKVRNVGGDPGRAQCEIHLQRYSTNDLFTYTKDVAIV